MTDLAAVASRLSRAADLIEAESRALQVAGHGPHWESWDSRDIVTADETGTRGQEAAESVTSVAGYWIAAFDPWTMAALVPLLRRAASHLHGAGWCDVCDEHADLHTFAARLLGEEEQ